MARLRAEGARWNLEKVRGSISIFAMLQCFSRPQSARTRWIRMIRIIQRKGLPTPTIVLYIVGTVGNSSTWDLTQGSLVHASPEKRIGRRCPLQDSTQYLLACVAGWINLGVSARGCTASRPLHMESGKLGQWLLRWASGCGCSLGNERIMVCG